MYGDVNISSHINPNEIKLPKNLIATVKFFYPIDWFLISQWYCVPPFFNPNLARLFNFYLPTLYKTKLYGHVVFSNNIKELIALFLDL